MAAVSVSLLIPNLKISCKPKLRTLVVCIEQLIIIVFNNSKHINNKRNQKILWNIIKRHNNDT